MLRHRKTVRYICLKCAATFLLSRIQFLKANWQLLHRIYWLFRYSPAEDRLNRTLLFAKRGQNEVSVPAHRLFVMYPLHHHVCTCSAMLASGMRACVRQILTTDEACGL